ncbi:type IV pilus biogenesis/stability protein PilW [Mergibacter septicus]|nr:type IV pilus biogenesis/stability protein PilW [Mergibacter septicus]
MMLRISRLIILLFTLMITGCVTSRDTQSGNKIDQIKLAKIRVELGLGYLAQNNLPQAKVNFDKALQQAPQHYLPHLGLAYFYQQSGEVEKAEIEYQQALMFAPMQGDVLNNYATFLCARTKYQSAFQLFERALEGKGYYRFADTYQNIALCAFLAKDRPRAVWAIKQLATFDPEKAKKTAQLSPFKF